MKSHAYRLASLLVGLACSGAGAVAPTSMAQELEDREVRSALERIPEAWNAHDAQGWASAFCGDGTFTDRPGATSRNRNEIAAMEAALFKRVAKASTLRAIELDVRPIEKSAAIAQARYELSGIATPAAYGPVDGTYQLLAILRRESGSWCIAAMQWIRLP